MKNISLLMLILLLNSTLALANGDATIVCSDSKGGEVNLEIKLLAPGGESIAMINGEKIYEIFVESNNIVLKKFYKYSDYSYSIPGAVISKPSPFEMKVTYNSVDEQDSETYTKYCDFLGL